jgi:hypothetical protein
MFCNENASKRCRVLIGAGSREVNRLASWRAPILGLVWKGKPVKLLCQSAKLLIQQTCRHHCHARTHPGPKKIRVMNRTMSMGTRDQGTFYRAGGGSAPRGRRRREVSKTLGRRSTEKVNVKPPAGEPFMLRAAGNYWDSNDAREMPQAAAARARHQLPLVLTLQLLSDQNPTLRVPLQSTIWTTRPAM